MMMMPIDYSKSDAASAPQGVRSESVTEITERPEDADLMGWVGPGWYFWDEAYQLHGPFETEKETSAALSMYCAEMLGGNP